jgi:subtilisin family serine protease
MWQWLSRCAVVAIALVVSVLPVYAQPGVQGHLPTEVFQGREVAAREVLVKFRGATSATIFQAGQQEDVDLIHEVGRAGALRLRSRSKDVATLVKNLSARPDVEFAEPNFIVHTTATPTDPSFGQLWGLQNTGQSIQGVIGTPGADIRAVPAWDITIGSTSNVVAVVDTGIDYTHPDLAANVWSAPHDFTVTIGGQTILCLAGTHGFNALTNTCDPKDDNNHGTHTSGTIGAVGNNLVGVVGVVGVNWTASIMGVKFLNSGGNGSTAGAINAIEFAIQAKAIFGSFANVRVLSNSWGGGGFSQALLDQINKANTNNMLFVAAAGNAGSNNDATPFYPANYAAPNVVAVAATDNRDARASFSNYGATTVDLGAPGVNVLSTVIGSSYSYFSGTSMATPHVSGAAALVLSQCALTTAALRDAILSNVDPIPSMAGITVTGGRLNVNKALGVCAAPVGDFTVSAAPPSQTVTAGGSTTYTVTIGAVNNFGGVVTFGATGLPAGVTAGFNPTFVTASGLSTMTLMTDPGTPAGTYPVTITGTSGSLSHTTSVSLVVQSVVPPDFTLSVSPTSRSVTTGSSTTYTATISALNGFGGTVTFAVSGLPAGAAASFSPSSVTGSGSSTLTIATNVSAPTPLGTSTLTIKATSGALSHTISVSLTVTCRTLGSSGKCK